MLALINITEIPEVIKYQGETLCEIIKSHIENVSDSYAGTIRSVSDDVIFGATNPVKFLAMAQDWNECIRRDAINTVNTWLKNALHWTASSLTAPKSDCRKPTTCSIPLGSIASSRKMSSGLITCTRSSTVLSFRTCARTRRTTLSQTSRLSELNY